MPLPTPKKSENYRAFMSRFLKDAAVKKEYKEIKKRFAEGVSKWNKKK